MVGCAMCILPNVNTLTLLSLLYSLSQPSDELVKEVQELSLECLAKVEAARTAGDFHEVTTTTPSFTFRDGFGVW